MKTHFYIVFYALFFNFKVYSQTVELSPINFERVNYSNSIEESEKKFNQTIAYVINDYVNKYYKNNYNVKIVNIGNSYDVRIDNEMGSLLYQLQNRSRNVNYWLYITLPDSMLSLVKILNIIDLGYSTSDSMINCLNRYINAQKWFPHWDCYLSAELIENKSEGALEAKKYRFLKRMKRKYRLDNIECISKDKF